MACMGDLLAPVRLFADRHSLLPDAATVVVGLSGGPDSLCLLHLLKRLAEAKQLHLHVAHLNHGLRGADAAEDAAFAETLAARYGLPFTGERVNAGALALPGVSQEEAARQARYAFLARVAHHVGAAIIAVGHHADDQAETVLMHFLRGSGVAGLGGMLPRTPLADYRLADAPALPRELWLVRPLLGVTRPEILTYCAQHGLTPRLDASNADVTIYRNRLRHELLPLLESYNPRIRQVLAHTADVMAGEHETLQHVTGEAVTELTLPAPSGEIHYDLVRWRGLVTGVQRATLRAAIAELRCNLRNIDWQHIERALWLASGGATGQSATLTADLALHLRYDRLIIGPATLPPGQGGPQITAPVALKAPGVTLLSGGWRVEATLLPRDALPPAFTANADPWSAFLDAEIVGSAPGLRPRLPGDRFHPHGLAGHSARVNEFMINARVSRENRPTWPLLIGAGGIAWLCGLRLDDAACVRAQTMRVWHVRFFKE